MITSIQMRGCATYSTIGANIDNCQKINFFYGPNGSGKSTIGNYLQDQSSPLYSQCKITWEHDDPSEVIVYNKSFRARHFQENISGVFTLGQATIEDVNALNEMKAERLRKLDEYNVRRESLEKKRGEEKKHKDDFRDTIWTVLLKRNENDFQEAFTGFRSNKERFRDQVIFRFSKSHSSEDTRDSLLKRAGTLFSSKPEKCELFAFSISLLAEDLSVIQDDSIWSTVIVGNDDVPISKLINHLGNADWVNKGRHYITEGQICPFCQQKTITKELSEQLNRFFSGEYESNINKIKSLIERYSDDVNQLIRIIDSVFENQKGISISKLDEENWKSHKASISALCSEVLTEMRNKLQEPSRKILIPGNLSLLLQEITEIISSANETIKDHNKMVDNYIEERNKLIDDIWNFLLSEQEPIINSYLKGLQNINNAKKGIQSGIDRCKEQLDSLDERIYSAGKNITSVQPAVDEINRSLRAYGFTNFMIVPSPVQENAYQIQRMDGTLATNTLSEGEETFITFLYFLQFAKGSEDISKVSTHKILVLDDPISSLDSTILYIVSSMVKALIKDVRDGVSDVDQVFILTHNVFFHKEASFVDGRTKIMNDVNYWIISKDNNITTIRAYEKNNPIKTSYELLWQELKADSNASLVTVQNIMRRILENYFSILGKGIDDTIVNSFGTTEEKMICRSLISWINDGSHTIPDDLYIDSYTDSIDRYKDVFREIFIKMDHKAHYDMMMA